MRFGSNFRSQLATRIAATIPTIPNSRVEAAGRARAAVAEFAEFAEAVIAPLAPLAEAAVEAAVEAVVEAGAGPAPKTRNRHTALVVTAALGVTAVAATAAYVWWKRREQPLAATLDASNAPDSTDAPDVPPTALHTWPDRGAATAVAESPARDETPPPSAPTPVRTYPRPIDTRRIDTRIYARRGDLARDGDRRTSRFRRGSRGIRGCRGSRRWGAIARRGWYGGGAIP